jgi:maleamate amidohydrolase
VAIWDDYLSPRDKELLAAGWEKTAPFGLGARPALVVVDNIVGLLGRRAADAAPLREASAGGTLRFGSEAWEAIDRTKHLLEAARTSDALIAFTTVLRPPAWGRLRADDLIGDMERDVVPDIAPLPSELVIGKDAASAFFGTSLVAHLVSDGVDSVVVCGNSTSGCVRATVLDASSYGFRTAVVEDCTFDRTEASHAMSLFDMHQKYADLLTAEAAAAYFTECAASRSATK